MAETHEEQPPNQQEEEAVPEPVQNRELPLVIDTLRFHTESHENPFLADGELSKKAEYIIKHSTISRTEIRISDPDLHKNMVTAAPEEVIVSESTPLNAAPPPSNDPKENGQLEKAVKAKPVEAEVGKANASQPEPLQAEQVKLKDNKKCKCCVVQ